MQNSTVRDAALQHMASNKIKAAAAVLEKHIAETEKTSEDTPKYSIDTFELETALRKGMATLEYLREVRANTEENHIKAVASSSVNREFREQSSWWLPKQELPQSWFPPPPSAVPNKHIGGPRTPRPVSPKHPPPATPTTVIQRPTPSSQQLRALGLTEEDVALALGEPPPAPLQEAAPAVAADVSPRRIALSSTSWVNRGSRASLTGGSSRSLMSTSGSGAAPAAVSASERVAWALRRGAGGNGSEKPVLYDGGGDAAVPGIHPVGLVQPPPGYPRYTLNLFEQQQQLQRHSASSRELGRGRQGRQGDLLVIQSDEEEDGVGERTPPRGGTARRGSGSGGDESNGPDSCEANGGAGTGGAGGGGLVLGTGFRALSEEDPHSGFQHVALSTAINSAVARVTASNAEAKGAGRTFGMVGSVGPSPAAAPAPPDEAPPLTPRSNSARVRPRDHLNGRSTAAAAAAAGTAAGGAAAAAAEPPLPYDVSGPDYFLPIRQSSPMVSGVRPSGSAFSAAAAGITARNSSPGIIEAAGRVSTSIAVSAIAEVSSPILPSSPSLAGGGLVPTPPPPQAQDGKGATSFRIGRPQPPHRSVLHSESARGSAPASPQAATRVALSGFSGRLRLGATSASGVAPEGSDASPGSGAATPTAGAAALRARLRVLAVPGGDEDSAGSSGGAAADAATPTMRVSSSGGVPAAALPFARSLLAPASPAAVGPGGHMDSPFYGSQLQQSSRMSERSLLAGSSANSLDVAVSTPGSATATAAGAAVVAAGDEPEPAADPGAGGALPTLAPGLRRTMSRRRMRPPSSDGAPPPPSADSSPPPLPPPNQQQPRTPPAPPQPVVVHQYSPSGASAGGGADTPPVPSPASNPGGEADGSKSPGLPPSELALRVSPSFARRPASAGGRASPLSSAGGAALGAASPTTAPAPPLPFEAHQAPAHDSAAETLAASTPLPAVRPQGASRQQPQLMRLPSRSFDSAVPPNFGGGADTIREESDDSSAPDDHSSEQPRRSGVPVLNSSHLHQAPPLAATGPGSLPSPRVGASSPLLPSPRPTSAHASNAPSSSPMALLSRRQPSASMPAAVEHAGSPSAASIGAERDLPPCPVVPAGRARRSSMPSGQSDPSIANGAVRSGQSNARITQPGAASEARPWEAPPISPRPSRGGGSGGGGGGASLSVSGSIPGAPGGGAPNLIVNGGGAQAGTTGMAARQLQGTGASPGSHPRSVSVSGGLPPPPVAGGRVTVSGAVPSPSGPVRIPRLSTTGLSVEDAPSSPVITAVPQGPEYRLSVGPMPTGKKIETAFIKQTLDI